MNNSTDQRLIQIKSWLKNVVTGDFEIEPASSDASFRRYFRVKQNQRSWIVMDAPPQHEDIAPFICVAEHLFHAQLNVPALHARDTENGFLLLSDLGSTPLLHGISSTNADSLYQDAIEQIIKMQRSDNTTINLPEYDAELLQKEMDLFAEWFLQEHLNVEIPTFLNDIQSLLVTSAQQQAQRFVHRDYHSRNLMIVDTEQPLGIIDFQDAVNGPVSYDLVSLLKDVYIEWPQQQRDEWLLFYYQRAVENGLLNINIDTFTRDFDLMGLQRHLKILGIFCRLNYRDNKPGYLSDLPLTLKYVLDVSQRYPELKALDAFLRSTPQIMAIL